MPELPLSRTCIVCPRGCRLRLRLKGAEVSVEGNACPKGEEYGIREATSPRRVLTTTIRTTFPHLRRLPVKSSTVVPLADIPRLMRFIGTLCLDRAVSFGEIVCSNVLDTGVNLVATDEVDRA